MQNDTLSIDSFLEWEDIRDTLANGSIDKNGIVDMIKSSQKNKSSNELFYEDFKKFVDTLNDYIIEHGPEANDDGFETFDDGEVPLKKSTPQDFVGDERPSADDVFEDEYKTTYDMLCGVSFFYSYYRFCYIFKMFFRINNC